MKEETKKGFLSKLLGKILPGKKEEPKKSAAPEEKKRKKSGSGGTF